MHMHMHMYLNCPKEKSLASTACCPSWPLMPTPMCAAKEREEREEREER